MRHRKYEHHLANLRNVKASIDTRDPRRPKQGNSKGAYLEAERNNQIMHENTILLNKLSRILTRDPEPIPEPRLVSCAAATTAASLLVSSPAPPP